MEGKIKDLTEAAEDAMNRTHDVQAEPYKEPVTFDKVKSEVVERGLPQPELRRSKPKKVKVN